MPIALKDEKDRKTPRNVMAKQRYWEALGVISKQTGKSLSRLIDEIFEDWLNGKGSMIENDQEGYLEE